MPGDRVVVEGFQKFAAGDKVRPVLWSEADASDVTGSTGAAVPAKTANAR
jgi:membrane fusion protein (multidrug efflux system)